MTSAVRPPLVVAVSSALALLGACDVPLDGIALDAAPQPPGPPVLAPPTTPTSSSTAVLRGTRPANTALVLDGEVVVARGEPTAFRIPVVLAPGFNTFVLHSVDVTGRASDDVAVTIARDDVAPVAVGFTTVPPVRTARVRLTLTGTKESSCTLWQDGRPRADVAFEDAFFPVDEELAVGDNRFRFACVDAAGNESPLSQLEVDRLDVEGIPFVLAPPPADVASNALVLSATCDDDVEAQAGSLEPTRCSGGGWSAEVPLVDGDNEITVRAAFVGELASVARVSTFHVQAATAAGEGEGEGEGESP